MTDQGQTTDAAALLAPGYRHDPEGSQPALGFPDYRSTALRVPHRPLTLLPHRLTEVTGPLLGEDLVGETDHDLTVQHDGEPLGERIVVEGRVLDGDGRPPPASPVGNLQAERGRP